MTITVSAQGKEFNFPNGTSNDQIGLALDEFFSSEGVDNGIIDNGSAVRGVGSDVGERLDQTLPEGTIGAGVIEPLGTIVTGAIAEPIAGLAGIVGGLLPGEEGQGQRAIEATREALTFKPKTRQGQEALEAVGEVLAPIAEAITGAESALGDATFEATGSPALAAAATAIPTLATEILGIASPVAAVRGVKAASVPAKKLIKEQKITRELNEALPTIDQLKDTSRAVYQEIDDFGVTIKNDSFSRLTSKLVKSAKREGLDPTLTPKTEAALGRFEAEVGNDINLTQVDTLRKVAQNAAKSIEPADARLGSMMIETIDQFLDDLNPSELRRAFGTPKDIGSRYKAARELWGRARRSELIQDAFQKADLQASGFENGIRTQFRSILNNKKKRRFFKANEIEAMNKVVKGDKAENLAKLVGRLGFSEGGATNIIGGLSGVAVGGAIAGGPGALIVPVIGQLSRKLAQRMTSKNAEFADEVIRSGKDGRKIVEAYLENTPKNQISSSELSELLMRPDIELKGIQEGSLIDEAVKLSSDRRLAAQGASTGAAASGSLESTENTKLQDLLQEQEDELIQ